MKQTDDNKQIAKQKVYSIYIKLTEDAEEVFREGIGRWTLVGTILGLDGGMESFSTNFPWIKRKINHSDLLCEII